MELAGAEEAVVMATGAFLATDGDEVVVGLFELLATADVLALGVALFSVFSSVFLTGLLEEEVLELAKGVTGFLATGCALLEGVLTVGVLTVDGLLVVVVVFVAEDGFDLLEGVELPLELLLELDEDETEECLATGAGTGPVGALEELLTEFFRFESPLDSSWLAALFSFSSLSSSSLRFLAVDSVAMATAVEATAVAAGLLETSLDWEDD